MGDNKEFDVDKIKHGEFMDAKDRLYFEKYGPAMEEQAEIIEENLDDYMTYAEETYDSVLRHLYDNRNRYLVNGAPLKCSKMVTTEQKIDGNGKEIVSSPDLTEDKPKLYVPESRKEKANDLPFANVTDTRGGLSGELLKGGAKEGEKKENQLNIASFGNCSFVDEENPKKVDVVAERVLT